MVASGAGTGPLLVNDDGGAAAAAGAAVAVVVGAGVVVVVVVTGTVVVTGVVVGGTVVVAVVVAGGVVVGVVVGGVVVAGRVVVGAADLRRVVVGEEAVVEVVAVVLVLRTGRPAAGRRPAGVVAVGAAGDVEEGGTDERVGPVVGVAETAERAGARENAPAAATAPAATPPTTRTPAAVRVTRVRTAQRRRWRTRFDPCHLIGKTLPGRALRPGDGAGSPAQRVTASRRSWRRVRITSSPPRPNRSWRRRYSPYRRS